MEKVQNLKNSNTAPSSKTFRDELLIFIYLFFGTLSVVQERNPQL
jgi:hypothetical protein